jgi:transcriptional regulator with PAS, ATPase and Fis domain
MARRDGDTLSLEGTTQQAREPAAGSLLLLLEYQRPSAGSARYLLDEVIIGRGPQRAVERTRRGTVERLTLRAPDRFMSREHVKLVRFAGQWRAIDLQSKNGIVVDGEPCDKATLRDGAIVEVGQTAFLVRSQGVPRQAPWQLHDLCTWHDALGTTLDEAARLAKTDVPVLLLGETGTGKEVVARALHAASQRKGALVAVNCAALPRTLLETELFGHRKGAFSGADADRVGLVRSADGGTLFLDELGELPESAQAALLRVLEEKAVVAVGDTRPVRVDFRLVAATNRDLPRLVETGAFRADLYARLMGLVVKLPRLSERREDLGMLIASILARSTHTPERVTLTNQAARALLAHPWPHNVRQLSACLKTAIGLSDELAIDLYHLKLDQGEGACASQPPPEPERLNDDEQAMRTRIVQLLSGHGGNVAQVARELGKAPTQVYRWMQRYGIRPGQFRV